MDANSQQKLIAAGYTILHTDYDSANILYKGKKGSNWKIFELFKTKAERDRRMKELLEKQNYIFD